VQSSKVFAAIQTDLCRRFTPYVLLFRLIGTPTSACQQADEGKKSLCTKLRWHPQQ
jgi:hypothetical protein